ANGTFDGTGGNVTINSGGKLYMASTITDFGTLSNSGTMYFDGTTQTIPGNSAKATQDLGSIEIDNANKTLEADGTEYQISGTLTFGAGSPDLDVNGTSLTFMNGSSISGATDAKHIIGAGGTDVSVKYSSSSTTAFELPIGPDGSLRSISLTPSATTATVYTVQYKVGSPYGGAGTLHNVPTGSPINSSATAAHVNNHYYYDVSPTVAFNTNITVGFIGLDNSPPSTSDRYLMHWDGSEWDQLTTTATSGNTVTATATSFSPFTQGSGGSALPIDLVSFTGVCENNETEIEFVVASQINNDYFSIYRSTNVTDWNLVGEIEGAGNTNTQLTYKWIDNNPLSGVSYYKLAQTDYDGTSEAFSPIAVMCEASAIDGYSVYPNPANEVLNIDLELENFQGDDVSIEVIDINGKIIQLQQVQLNRGYNHLEVDLSEIPSGVYMINFVGTRDYIKESRIIKQ
ncbi:MAG: hypothetical protein CL838_00190, partial [Crocinitomicaceae bacterium]|nr:hypothetical protein [Crocinitomicaceae bacterium]